MNILLFVPPSKFSRNVARDLIYGCWCKGKRIAGIQFPPLTLLFVATCLQNAGHKVKLIDAASQAIQVDSLKKIILEFDAAVVLTSSMTIKEDAEILLELKKKNKSLRTIIFGSQPTFMPEHSLAREGIDIVVRREPEAVIVELISAIEKNDGSWKSVLGIGFKDALNGNKIQVNEYHGFIENLDDLPFPDRTMLAQDIDYFNPVVKRIPYTTIFTSRGCPGRCIYCSSPVFYGRTIRMRSADSVIEELKVIQSQGYREVFYRDEIFTVSRNRVVEICEGMLKNKINLTWICSARIGTVDKELLQLMKKAGCHLIRFGVESGVQQILDAIQKDITIEQTEQTFKWVHEVGIDTHAHLMLGMPGETIQTISQSIAFVKKIDPTIITVGMCTPYPGTKLFNLVCQAHPEINDGSGCDLQYLHTKSFYNEAFSELSSEELSRNIRRFYREFYLRVPYLLRWFRRIASPDEFRRVVLAGANVFDFIFRGG